MEKKIHKILACVDFSEYSLMVLEYAVELAKNSNTQIIVYNVINIRDVNEPTVVVPFSTIIYSNTNDTEDYVKNLKKDRQTMIKSLINEHFFKEKSNMSFIIDLGVPYEQILKTIDKENIDLIVMANKGRGNISRFLFGSAAEKVFRHSPVPVVSVRDREKFKRKD